MKEKNSAPEIKYKRELKLSEGKLIMDETAYVPIPENFSETLVDSMKNQGFWENIISVDGKDYMEERRFNIYKKLSETLKNI